MLKKRVAANIVVKDGLVVQSVKFKKYLPVGKPKIAIEFLNLWGIDEIILTDISASKKKLTPNFDIVHEISSKCFVPLTVGGGITNTEHIKKLMHCGADKISINQIAIFHPEFITKAAGIFGNQCIVVSIDAIKENNKYFVFDYINKKQIKISPAELAKQSELAGAGELLINSVDRDGTYLGYDIELINSVCEVVKIPVICCGGAKNANDFIEVFCKTNVSAASAANFFHFTEHSVITTKANIIKKHNIRIETHATYYENNFNEDLRLLKSEDHKLEEMLFVKIEKEII